MWGIVNRHFIFAFAGALLVSSSSVSVAKEWWQDTFIKEGSGTCEGNDSIRTFTAKEMESWETSCKITKQQLIKRIDAVILDYECGGDDMEPEIYKPREMVVKDHDGIRIYPDGTRFQSCNPVKAVETPKSATTVTAKSASQESCPVTLSLLKSDPRNDGTYQTLEFKDGFLDAQATLTGYKNDKPIWTAKSHATCSNGAVICRMTFKTRAGEGYQEAYQPLTVEDQPWVVFAELRQTLFMKEQNPAYERKAYGGIEVELLNGYQPAADEMILPENVYKFSGCSTAEGETE